MELKNEPLPPQALEQRLYAAWLDAGTRLGLLLLVLSFAAYVSGWLAPQVPLEQLPALWALPVDEYLAATGLPTGWGWLALLPRADMLGLLGIVILAGVSVPCLLALVPIYADRREWAFVGVVLAEAAVVLLAASGWIAAGH